MKIMSTLTLILLLFLSNAQDAPLKVQVTDFNKVALKGEQVLFVNQTSKKIVKGISNEKGEFKISLPVGKYDIELKSVGAAQDYSTLEIPKIGENQTYQEMSMQIMISAPKSFTLDNLNFPSGQATILKSSYSELTELVKYLKLKPKTRIEIAGHTDSDGEEVDNLSLSQKRADAVKKYLVSKGINTSRLISKGYGETSPIADNSTANGKAKNRRTEVIIR